MATEFSSHPWDDAQELKPGIIFRDTTGQIPAGYFRYDRSQGTGPLCANDYISSKIGREGGMPVATVMFRTHLGRMGSVSLEAASGVEQWQSFGPKDQSEILVELPQIADLLVFDAFIHNTDRGGANFLYRANQSNKYDLFLIDHAHAIYGPTAGSGQPMEINVDSTASVQEFKALLLKLKFDFVAPSITKIESLADDTIRGIVNEVPADYFQANERDFIIDFLIHRKSTLRSYFEEYCRTH